MFEISFGFDELPADPEDVCYTCKEPITGKKYIPYLQFGSPEEVAHFKNIVYCEACYNQPDESPRTV